MNIKNKHYYKIKKGDGIVLKKIIQNKNFDKFFINKRMILFIIFINHYLIIEIMKKCGFKKVLVGYILGENFNFFYIFLVK